MIKATQVGGGAESQGGKGHGDPRSRSAQGLGTAECLPGMCQALGSTSSMAEAAGVGGGSKYMQREEMGAWEGEEGRRGEGKGREKNAAREAGCHSLSSSGFVSPSAPSCLGLSWGLMETCSCPRPILPRAAVSLQQGPSASGFYLLLLRKPVKLGLA